MCKDYIVCELCREKFDPTDLSNVLKHEHRDGLSCDLGRYKGIKVKESK